MAQIKTYEIPSEHKKTFCCEGGETLEQVARRGFGASICGDAQKPAAHGLGQHALADPCLSRGLDQ